MLQCGRRWPVRLLALCALFVFGPRGPAEELVAQNWPEFRPDVKVGFDGSYKLGLWTPVRVTLRGGRQSVAGKVRLTVLDGDETPCAVDSPLVQVFAGQTVPVTVYQRFGRQGIHLKAEFLDPLGRLLSEEEFRATSDAARIEIEPGQQFILTLGSSLKLNAIIDRHRWPGNAKPVVVNVTRAADLPARWCGYEAVATLILTWTQAELLAELSDAQRAALLEWIRQGGRAIVSIGGTAATDLLQPGQPLADLLPGKLEKFLELPSSRGFESFANDPSPLFPQADTKLNVPQLSQVRGTVLASEGADLPLIVRAPLGFGEVTFIAGDLNDRLFSEWRGRTKFFEKLLGWDTIGLDDKPGVVEPQGNYYDDIPISDLSSQLRGSLENFPGVQLVPFWIVASLIVVYILLIGPGDYFFVRAMKRMEWTWITFPVLVIVVSVGSYYLAIWLKGDQVRINQGTVIDVDVAANEIRGTTWFNLFSPLTSTYTLSLETRLPKANLPKANGSTASEKTSEAQQFLPGAEPRILLSWFGLPESTFAGAYQKPQGPGLSPTGTAYEVDVEKGVVVDAPIQVWSTKCFTARWSQADVKPLSATVLCEKDDVRRATFTNHLAVPLSNVRLVYGRWSYPVADLPPGKEILLQPSSADRVDFSSELEQLRQIFDQQKGQFVLQRQPYLRESTDVPHILQVMMFHELIRGREHTGLWHRFQGFLDASRLLGPGQAMLLARADLAGAVVHNHGQPLQSLKQVAVQLNGPYQAAVEVLTRVPEVKHVGVYDNRVIVSLSATGSAGLVREALEKANVPYTRVETAQQWTLFRFLIPATDLARKDEQ